MDAVSKSVVDSYKDLCTYVTHTPITDVDLNLKLADLGFKLDALFKSRNIIARMDYDGRDKV